MMMAVKMTLHPNRVSTTQLWLLERMLKSALDQLSCRSVPAWIHCLSPPQNQSACEVWLSKKKVRLGIIATRTLLEFASSTMSENFFVRILHVTPTSVSACAS